MLVASTLSLVKLFLIPTLASTLNICRPSLSVALAMSIEFSNTSTVAKWGICLIHITNCLRRTTNALHFWFNWVLVIKCLAVAVVSRWLPLSRALVFTTQWDNSEQKELKC